MNRLSTHRQEIGPWVSIPNVYHATREPGLHSNAVPTERLVYGKTYLTGVKEKMAIFGCRNWPDGTAGHPNQSPYGDQQYVVRATSVFQDGDDYLFPLKGFGKHGRIVQQSTGNTHNWYFEFVYIKKQDIAPIKAWIDTDWISQWKLKEHPYVRLKDENVDYATKINNHRVWYQFLVPYIIPFNSATLLDHKRVEDTGGWKCGIREVTEPKTLNIIICLLSWYKATIGESDIP